MDGVQAAREIREREKENPGTRLPIVAMTAHALKGDKEKYLECGMDGYIAKPVLLNELAEVVDGMIARFGLDGKPNASGGPNVASHGLTYRAEYEKTDGENLPAGEDALDYDVIAKSFVGNTELTIHSMEIFIRDVPGLIVDIGDAIDRRDNSGLIVSAHTLKGIVGYYSNSAPFKACQDLEALGRVQKLPGDLVAVTRQESVVLGEMQKLIQSMTDYIASQA